MFHQSGVEGRPRDESRRDGVFLDRDLQNLSKPVGAKWYSCRYLRWNKMSLLTELDHRLTVGAINIRVPRSRPPFPTWLRLMLAVSAGKQKAKAEAFAFLKSKNPARCLVANYDGLGKTVIDCAAIRVNQCVDHSQTKYRQRDDVTERALYRLSSGRNHSGTQIDGSQ
ncbi:MAG: hypothetical protein QOE96_3189 [Blastocatellia bacterium]|nr:hypothetical protein [Blastocatellia bacterium]